MAMSDTFRSRTAFVPRKRRSGATVGGIYTYNGITSDAQDATSTESQSDKQDKLTFDSYPTEGSSNPVTSDGINKMRLDMEDELEEFSEAVRKELEHKGSSVEVEELTAAEVQNIWDSITV